MVEDVRAVQLEICFAQYREEMVRSLTRWSRDGAGAEDAVQEAYVRAALRRETLGGMPEKALRAWLYTAAHRRQTPHRPLAGVCGGVPAGRGGS
jgi:DNA-directed RNA polymerase specialized sigma24 family protein